MTVSATTGQPMTGDAGPAAVGVPYRLTRLSTIMTPEPGNPFEVEGVLNPASGRGADGRLYLLPRLVGAGNVSRVGLAEVEVTAGVPTGVIRRGIALAPDELWEHGEHSAGVEDPRVTFISALGLHVMTYVAFGPMGPRTALAVSPDLLQWRRLGPLLFDYSPELRTDLNLFTNKDTVWFGEPVTGPDGRSCFALLHRPSWDLGLIRPGAGVRPPAGVTDPRPAIWVSFVAVADVLADLTRLATVSQHRFVAGSVFGFEELKIGGGPPPIRVPEGWLLLHHGVTGELAPGWEPQRHVHYAAGAIILDATDVTRVVARTAEPLLVPEADTETRGTVDNVVFPTATEEIDGQRYVFYGMADARIGVARLDRLIPG
jgi:predicted GH43/DUF377 family glycosyl hydrolase